MSAVRCGIISIIFLMGMIVTPNINGNTNKSIKLVKPSYTGKMSVEETLLKRRSIRNCSNELISFKEISQLLWSAQGITGKSGQRTAPSAGALYPLETYLFVRNVSGLDRSVYKYNPHKHELKKIISEDRYSQLTGASRQLWLKKTAAIIMFSAVYKRITPVYGVRGIRYTDMEAGHAAENVLLQAVALGIGTTVVGAFDDDKVRKAADMPKDETPLYMVTICKCKHSQ